LPTPEDIREQLSAQGITRLDDLAATGLESAKADEHLSALLEIEAATPEDILEQLRTQDITELDDLVREGLERAKTDVPMIEGRRLKLSPRFSGEIFVGDWFVYREPGEA